MISYRLRTALSAAILALVPLSAHAQGGDALARRAGGRGPQWLNLVTVPGRSAMYVDTSTLRRTPEGMRVNLRFEHAEADHLNDGTPYYGAEMREVVDCEGGRVRDLQVSPLDAEGKPFRSMPFPHQEWKPFSEHSFLNLLGHPLCLRIAEIMMTGQ